MLGRIDDALKYLLKAHELLALHGVGIWPHTDIAEIYMELGELDEAIGVYEECVNQCPQDNAVKQMLLNAKEKRDANNKLSSK